MNHRKVPYNTGKVKIGVYYEPPRKIPHTSAYEYRLQSKIMGWSNDTGVERMERLVVKVCIAIVLAVLVFVV